MYFDALLAFAVFGNTPFYMIYIRRAPEHARIYMQLAVFGPMLIRQVYLLATPQSVRRQIATELFIEGVRDQNAWRSSGGRRCTQRIIQCPSSSSI